MKMKIKVTQFTLNIMLWFILWLIITWTIHIVENTYYRYAPITNFIDFQALDLADYRIWDEFQMVYAYRNSKIETVWDFTFKTFCNWISLSEWNSVSNNVLLQKTKWLQKIKIKARIWNKLPVWKCEVYTHIDVDVKKWINRHIHLYDTFNVLK